MVQMAANSAVAVASGRDVEIALHLVQVQAAVHAAAVRPAPRLRRLGPLGLLATEGHNVVDVLLAKALVVRAVPARARVQLAVLVLAEAVHALCVHPLLPVGGVAGQLVAGEDPVARRVLHVDVQIAAAHLDDDVEVDLHVVADALFDGKRVVLGAAPPAANLRPQEDAGDEEHGDGPFAAARRLCHILRLCLGWSRKRISTGPVP